jgi:hypothetical protein
MHLIHKLKWQAKASLKFCPICKNSGVIIANVAR